MSTVTRSLFVIPCFACLTDISTAASLPRLVKQIAADGGEDGSVPRDFCAAGSTLYFTANDRIHGRELWKSDGTAAGTVMVKDIFPGQGGEYEEEQPFHLTAVGNTLFFTVEDGAHGRELWKSDGTASGTVMIKDILSGAASSNPDRLTIFGNSLYFRARNAAGHDALWRTDGTPEGTVIVKDVNVSYSGDSVPDPMTVMNGALYFTANDGIHGEELWKSDGTPEGTALLKDIYTGPPGPNIYAPFYLTALGKTLYFTANDGVTGEELWKTDGTPEGTKLVKDIYTGNGDIYPHSLAAVGNTLYFVADDGTTGWELWKSDGTTGGTKLVKDIHPAGDTQFPLLLTGVGDTLFFVAGENAHGQELWKSDGTADGTVMVKDIRPGPAGGMGELAILRAGAGRLFFVPYDGELWTSDGTPDGTVLVGEPAPEGDAPSPEGLTVIGSTLFYSAYTPALGRELFAWDFSSTSADYLSLECLRPTPGTAVLRLNHVLPGVSYQLETSTGLSGWTTLTRATFTSPGTGDIPDPRPVLPPSAFYRVTASRTP